MILELDFSKEATKRLDIMCIGENVSRPELIRKALGAYEKQDRIALYITEENEDILLHDMVCHVPKINDHIRLDKNIYQIENMLDV